MALTAKMIREMRMEDDAQAERDWFQQHFIAAGQENTALRGLCESLRRALERLINAESPVLLGNDDDHCWEELREAHRAALKSLSDASPPADALGKMADEDQEMILDGLEVAIEHFTEDAHLTWRTDEEKRDKLALAARYAALRSRLAGQEGGK